MDFYHVPSVGLVFANPLSATRPVEELPRVLCDFFDGAIGRTLDRVACVERARAAVAVSDHQLVISAAIRELKPGDRLAQCHAVCVGWLLRDRSDLVARVCDELWRAAADDDAPLRTCVLFLERDPHRRDARVKWMLTRPHQYDAFALAVAGSLARDQGSELSSLAWARCHYFEIAALGVMGVRLFERDPDRAFVVLTHCLHVRLTRRLVDVVLATRDEREPHTQAVVVVLRVLCHRASPYRSLLDDAHAHKALLAEGGIHAAAAHALTHDFSTATKREMLDFLAWSCEPTDGYDTRAPTRARAVARVPGCVDALIARCVVDPRACLVLLRLASQLSLEEAPWLGRLPPSAVVRFDIVCEARATSHAVVVMARPMVVGGSTALVPALEANSVYDLKLALLRAHPRAFGHARYGWRLRANGALLDDAAPLRSCRLTVLTQLTIGRD